MKDEARELADRLCSVRCDLERFVENSDDYGHLFGLAAMLREDIRGLQGIRAEALKRADDLFVEGKVLPA
jgi:hypothetical protein